GAEEDLVSAHRSPLGTVSRRIPSQDASPATRLGLLMVTCRVRVADPAHRPRPSASHRRHRRGLSWMSGMIATPASAISTFREALGLRGASAHVVGTLSTHVTT